MVVAPSLISFIASFATRRSGANTIRVESDPFRLNGHGVCLRFKNMEIKGIGYGSRCRINHWKTQHRPPDLTSGARNRARVLSALLFVLGLDPHRK